MIKVSVVTESDKSVCYGNSMMLTRVPCIGETLDVPCFSGKIIDIIHYSFDPHDADLPVARVVICDDEK